MKIRSCNQWEAVTVPFHDKYGDFAYNQKIIQSVMNKTRNLELIIEKQKRKKKVETF